MKKTAAAFVLVVFSMALFLPFAFSSQEVNAQSSGYSIQRIDHSVQVLYSGDIVVTDSIQLSGQMPGTFEFGLPFKYSSRLLKAFAYDSNFQVLPVAVGLQLQQQSGFYGISVSLSAGTSNNFTAIFILSNDVFTQTSNYRYSFDFPAYLAFTQNVGVFSASITLPFGTSIVGVDKPDGIVNASSYYKQDLAAFTYAPATATFFSLTYGYIQKVDIPSLTRQISVNPSGALTCTDTYKIVNNSTDSIIFFQFDIPFAAKNVVARDQFGTVLPYSTSYAGTIATENVTLSVGLRPGESSMLSLDYSLPSISPSQSGRFVLNLDLLEYFSYYINSASVTVVPPEGATFVTPELSKIGSSTDMKRDAFQQTLTISRQGVSYIDSIIPSEDVVPIAYEFNSLWIAFRPASWRPAPPAFGSPTETNRCSQP